MEDFQNKRQKVYKVIMLIVITVFITFLITSIVMYNLLTNSKNAKSSVLLYQGNNYGLTQKIDQIQQLLQKHYLGDINSTDTENGAIKGYVAALNDPYTDYMTQDEWTSFQIDALGNYDGIGVYLTKDTTNNTIVIVSPIKGTPAETAGILPGDILLKVDDVSYTGDQLNDASNKIKGPDGTTVKLEIKRGDQTLDLEVQRQHIKINHVQSQVLSNNIGYIEISSFDEGTADEFAAACNDLNSKGIKSLIIDLRNNPGGLVQEALDVASCIVPKGQTTLIRMDKAGDKSYEKSTKDPIINVPTAVLVNENSASASEILCGALKDNGLATVVGMKTYGKGVIQQVFTLNDGSAIKITIEEYYTPAEKKINKVGITPDVEIDLPSDLKNSLQIDQTKDTQLKKAIEVLKK